MNRATFGAGVLASVFGAASVPVPVFAALRAQSVTLDALLGGLAPPREHTWVQYVLGAGVPYLKKVGYGIERTSQGPLAFIETQIGSDETTCNPNTIRKGYLRDGRYGDLLEPHDVTRYVMKSGTTFMLVEASRADRLWLLDEDNLYARGPVQVVATADDHVAMHARRFAARRVTLAFSPHQNGGLRAMTLWLTPAVPNGVGRMHATFASGDPFELRIDAFGRNYVSLVSESFDALRASQG
ncbi:MAG TPA: hypothetical protein VMA36_16235 [Candidatus Limnocylindria bacterium]|nr:hypothetical protein [Candidatus Limnocylindria bacterium]